MGNKKAKRKKSAKQRQLRERKDMMAANQDFPFLVDENTVNYVRKSHVMFIMRGLPGSGKSSLVSSLKTKYKRAVVCSADNYFLNENTGTYKFDANFLSAAHAQSQEMAWQACDRGKNVVIIDNTNIRRWEMQKYCHIASQFGYTVITVIPRTEWAFNPAILATKNKHRVTEDVLRKKCQQFELGLPLYWGWFLNWEDSTMLLDLGRKYLNICLNNVQLFQDFIKTCFEIEDVDLETLMFVYTRPHRANDSKLHCTALYASGKELAERRRKYSERDIVKKSMGKTFALHAIGFIFTPRTMGVRLLLNHRQLLLWENEDVKMTGQPKVATQNASHISHESGTLETRHGSAKSSVDPPNHGQPLTIAPKLTTTTSFTTGSSTDGAKPCDPLGPSSSRRRDSPDGSTRSSSTEPLPRGASSSKPDFATEPSDIVKVVGSIPAMLKSRPRFHPSEGLGSNAHLTLYVAPDVSASTTKSDLAGIVAVEKRELGHGKHQDVEGGAVRYYGEGQCAVYLNKPIRFNTIFSGKY